MLTAAQQTVPTSLSIVCSDVRLELLPARPYEISFTAAADSLGYAFDAQFGIHAIGSDRRTPFLRRPNSLAVMPKGCDVFSASSTGGEYLIITGSRLAVAKVKTNLSAGPAARAAKDLRRALLAPDKVSLLDLEAGVLCLLSVTASTALPRKAERWMTERRFLCLTEMIEERLDEGLTVGDLAREIGTSASFLTRAFSAFAGQSPYDYIVSRRIARARALLATTRRPLTDIALSCGFSSQSHMTSALTTRLGLTPTALRRSLLS
jgi:AraC family transcriptional regulator